MKRSVVVLSLALAGASAFALEYGEFASQSPVVCTARETIPGEAPSLLPAGRTFRLVWNDEFNGTALDESKWSYRTNFWGRRAHWFAAPEDETVEVKGGKVYLKVRKLANGQFVSPQLQTGCLMWDIPADPTNKGFWPLPKREKAKFEHRYGYYECRFRLQKMPGWWSAFWMQTETQGCSLDPARSGIEHDILESFNPGEIIAQCFHYNGYGKDYKGFKIPAVKNAFDKTATVLVGSEEFHTIGMLWEPDGYTVFIDGRQHGHKAGATGNEAVSHVPEFVLLTTECKFYREKKMTGGPSPDLEAAAAAGDAFVADYVRVYDLVK